MRTLSHLLLCMGLTAGCDIGSKDDDGGGGDGWGEEDGSATGGAEDGSTEDSGSADGGSEDGGSTGGSTGGATGGSTSDCTDYTMSLVEGVWFYPAVVRVALRFVVADAAAVKAGDAPIDGHSAALWGGARLASWGHRLLIVC